MKKKMETGYPGSISKPSLWDRGYDTPICGDKVKQQFNNYYLPA